MQRDGISLTDHASFLSNKITFLLDAMLGVVNIQQNAIIKIFSIMAVVFMLPTLVASIYGMNFHHGMIELDWDYGSPLALFSMVLVAVLPLVFFKWKKLLLRKPVNDPFRTLGLVGLCGRLFSISQTPQLLT